MGAMIGPRKEHRKNPSMDGCLGCKARDITSSRCPDLRSPTSKIGKYPKSTSSKHFDLRSYKLLSKTSRHASREYGRSQVPCSNETQSPTSRPPLPFKAAVNFPNETIAALRSQNDLYWPKSRYQVAIPLVGVVHQRLHQVSRFRAQLSSKPLRQESCVMRFH